MTSVPYDLLEDFEALMSECQDLKSELSRDDVESMDAWRELRSNLRRLDKRLARARRDRRASPVLMDSIHALLDEVQEDISRLRAHV